MYALIMYCTQTIYKTRKHRFNQNKNTLRKTVTEAKKKYFSNQFGKHEGIVKKVKKQTRKTIDNALHRKLRVKQYLMQYLLIQN